MLNYNKKVFVYDNRQVQMFNEECPLCGSLNLSITIIKPVWGSEEKEVHVVCNDCACNAPYYSWKLLQKENKAEKGID